MLVHPCGTKGLMNARKPWSRFPPHSLTWASHFYTLFIVHPGHAMLLDCRSQDPAQVPLADDGLVIVVTNSNVKHKLAGSQVPLLLLLQLGSRLTGTLTSL